MLHLQAPGSAHDPAVKGLQFHFDYMNPRYPGVDTFMKVTAPAVCAAAWDDVLLV